MDIFNSYSDAAAQLPLDAKWSSSFGHPGEGGYCEYHRDSAGKRYIIENGSYLECAPFLWAFSSRP